MPYKGREGNLAPPRIPKIQELLGKIGYLTTLGDAGFDPSRDPKPYTHCVKELRSSSISLIRTHA